MPSRSDRSPATDAHGLSLPAALALGGAGALLAGAAAAIALAGDMPHAVSLAERQAIIVATPIAVGLYAWREGTHARFGRLLVLAGVAWFFAALSSSSDGVIYSIGRMAGWTVEAGLIYLMLSFPSGRLTSPVDRWLAAGAAALVLVLFVPTVLFTESFPTPAQFSTCTASCPDNAFMLTGSEPALLDDVLVPLRELLVAVIMLAVIARLAYRIRHVTPLMRRTLTPVLVLAILRTLAIVAGLGLRRAGTDDSVLTVVTGLIALGLPAICIAFLIGLLRWRIHTADCLVSLAHALPGHRDPAQRRDLLADTLGDPTVELAYWSDEGAGGGWVDADDRPIVLPPPPSNRSATLIFDDAGPVAALIHDSALAEQRAFLEAVGAYAFVWGDNQRLAERVETSLSELRASRARILAAADDERRRIERDLHDGGQQRLVALRIRLELAEEVMDQSPSRARAMLHRLGDEVDAALDELRSLAAGVYPSLLEARGLTEALRTAALQSPIPASVAAEGGDRYPEDVETAAYFCCLEALQNVAKHAPEARSVSIALHRNGDLRFEVRDDGPGFSMDHGDMGDGLLNMRDRVSAVGGTLEIRSRPGEGTRVIGKIPVPVPA